MPKSTLETPLNSKTKSGHVLTDKEELFCNVYVETFDKIKAVLTAYNVDQDKPGWNQTARVIAHDNLTKVYINERIRELLDKHHLNDEEVDLELAHIIRQNAEYNPKRAAINEYNKIKGRHAAEKHEHKFKGASDEELRERASELITGVIGDTSGTGKKK